MPTIPFLTAREHVGKYDVFAPGYTLPSQYKDACIPVLRHADWVIVDRRWTDPDYLQRVFPAMQNPQPEESKAFEDALGRGFALVAQDQTFELRHRQPGISEAICADVAK